MDKPRGRYAACSPFAFSTSTRARAAGSRSVRSGTHWTSAPYISYAYREAGTNPLALEPPPFRTSTHRRPHLAHVAAVILAWFDFSPPIVTTVSVPRPISRARAYSILRTLLPPNPAPV